MVWLRMILLVGFIGLLWWTPVEAATIAAASCSGANVATAIGTAVDGDTVTIPAGACTWSTKITITNKSITLAGAGLGQTIITGDDTTAPCALLWTTKATGNTPAGFTRLTGITFLQTTNCPNGDDRFSSVQVDGNSHNWRMDHVRFELSRAGGIHFSDDARGVNDHNEYVSKSGGSFGTHMTNVAHLRWNNSGNYGDASWAAANSYGTADALYFEDSLFDNQNGSSGVGCTNDTHGARAVYRFNTWHECTFQTHGTESGGRSRGQRHTEHYRQLFTWSITSNQASIIAFRGGSAKVFDNLVTTSGIGGITRLIDINTYRRGGGSFNSFYPWGFCGQQTVTVTRSGTTATATTTAEHGVHGGGSYITITGSADANFNGAVIGTRVSSTQFTYPVSNTGATSGSGTMQGTFDANTLATGWRCLDQAGAGQSVLLSGDGPGGSLVVPQGSAANALDPAVWVHNTINGVESPGAPNVGADVILANRDYYNYNAACTGASCTTGVGMGTALPTSCTTGTYFYKTNDGSWNTSTTETYSTVPGADGVIYKCIAANSYAVDYTPYTYPHPLAAFVDTTPPSIPTGVTVTRVH